MKKSKIILLNLIYLICCFLLYNLISWILNINNLAFRHTASYTYFAIMGILSFMIIIQIIRFLYSLSKEKNNKLILRVISIFGAIFISLLLAITVFFTPFMLAWAHQPEHVVEKDNKKMVAYVNSFMQVIVYYYDYKNFFIRGKQLKILVDGGNGGYDPYKNGGEGPSVNRYIYYDDNGKMIDSNWGGY